MSSRIFQDLELCERKEVVATQTGDMYSRILQQLELCEGKEVVDTQTPVPYALNCVLVQQVLRLAH
jgi:hypothetical protein